MSTVGESRVITASQPPVAFTVAFLALYVFVAVEGQEVLWRLVPLVGQRTLPEALRIAVIVVPGVLFGLAWFRAVLAGWAYLAAALLVTGSAWVVVNNFRGVYIRPGTLDLYYQSAQPWMTQWLIAGVCGLAVGVLLRLLRVTPKPIAFREAVWTWSLASPVLIGSGLWATNLFDYSVFAPTRIWVNVLIVGFTGLLLFAGRREELS